MTFALAFFLAFLVGSVPTAYLVTLKLRGTDIRQQGSGNVGATNAFRVLGKGPGMFVFAIDFSKGAFAAFALPLFFGIETDRAFWVGFAAALGHVFTPFLGFKGGKGVATGSGIVCAFFPFLFLMGLGVWIALFFSTRMVSISSLLAITSLVPFSLVFGYSRRATLFLTCIMALLFWTHRSNIARLFAGKENKL